jgi:hydroxyacylglutathione hydrolase
MIFRQYLHHDPVVAASYLLGCGGKASGVVIDPVGDPDFYLAEANRLGLNILYVIDTHVHADHRSTGRELAAQSGAAYVLHQSVVAQFVFQGVADGDELRLGNVRLTLWHTPGHTPEHLVVLVTDQSRASEPWLILTGHTLMVGDLGRTELASSAEDGARDLYRSVSRLKTLPDYLEVWPGAFSGSLCGRGLSGKASSTIGFERRFNPALGFADEAEFVAMMLAGIPPRPQDFERLRAINLGQLV